MGVAQRQGLKRTVAEKELLRSISALEQGISDETDSEKRQQLLYQLNGLRGHLSRLSGTTYTDLRLENSRLRKAIEDANEKISQLMQLRLAEGQGPESEDAKLKFYRALISRYSDLINEKEQKTVGEIKALVNKDDLTIQSLAQGLMQQGYKFENHYFQSAEKAYNYAKDEIAFVDSDLGLSYWLLPKEIISEKIGDDEDIAVFLCSLLFALGDDDAECVIAELEDAKTHAFVITNFHSKFLLLDPVQKKPFREFYGQKKDVLEKYSFKGSRIKRFLYRFNRSKYEQYS